MNGDWFREKEPLQAIPIKILKIRMNVLRRGLFCVDVKVLRDTKLDSTGDLYPKGLQICLPAKEVFISRRSAHYWARKYCKEVIGLPVTNRDTFDDNCLDWLEGNF